MLAIEPYFVRPEQGPPASVEFRVGDYQDELGILYNPHCLEVLASLKGR